MTALRERRCKPCNSGTPPLGVAAAQRLLGEIPGWELNETATEISRTFSFKNYYQTISFVNALAWIAHQEDHHPELEVGYKRCRVRYSTHAIGGLSDNDFICAAKASALVEAN